MKKTITAYFIFALILTLFNALPLSSQPMPVDRGLRTGNMKQSERSIAPVHSNSEAKSVQAPLFPANLDEGETLLYGSVLSSTVWPSWDRPYGIYSLPPMPGVLFSPVSLNSMMNSSVNGVYANGNYHSISASEIIISHIDGTHSVKLVDVLYNVYDTDTWDLIESINKEVNYKNTPISLTYDALTDNVYAISYSDDKTGCFLSTMNTETGDITPIASVEQLYYTLSAGPDGKLYAIASDGNLYALDKNTGSPTLIGATGIKPAYAQSATFDPISGKFYWAAYIAEGNSGLYEVNPQTGKATLINKFPYGEQVVGLFVKTPLAENMAPAAVEKLKITPDSPGSLAGTITFSAPTKTYNGNSLSGELTYRIKVDDTFVKTGSCMPGEAINFAYTFAEGVRSVFVTTENPVGRSPRISDNTYFGNDIPLEVKNLTLSISPTGLASLNWSKPTETVHGGYLNDSSLTYRVIRNTDGTVVADNLTTTNFSEQLSDELASYSYAVTVYAGGREGGSAISESLAYGSSVALPYFNSFDDDQSVELFTILDLDDNDEAWRYSRQMGSFECWFYETADDWLITPPFNLGTTNTYKLSFSVKTSYNMEKLRITIGTSTDPATHSTLLDLIDFSYPGTPETYTHSFSVPSAGLYYIGFYYYAGEDFYYVQLHDIALVESAAVNGPQAVSALRITAAAGGALGANISFKTPERDVTGTRLNSLTKVLVYRDGKEVKEFLAPALNAELSWTDNNAVQGMNVYKVIAYSDGGIGEAVEQSVYVGEDTPGMVRNLAINTPDEKKAFLEWEAPVGGANGHHLSADKLTYTVLRFNRTKQAYEEITGGVNIQSLSFTDETLPAMSFQDLIEYAVVANSVAGQGAMTVGSVIIGDPYSLPFKESFPNQELSSDPWINEVITGNFGWMITGDPNNIGSQDNDGGILTFINQRWTLAECYLISPKIKIGNAGYPILSFWMYHFNEEEAADYLLDVLVSADYAPFETLKQSISVFGDDYGWKAYTIPLSGYKQANSIRLILKASAPAGDYPLFLDNIAIEHQLEDDLMLSGFDIPSKLNEGEEGEFVVSVMNKGRNAASGYQVELYQDEEKVAVANGLELASRAHTDIVIPYILPIADAGNDCSFYAKVVYSSDMDGTNNASDTRFIRFINPLYPAVNDLVGTSDNASNELRWTAPEATTAPLAVTESFESYDSFIIDNIGSWKVYDGDTQSEFSIEWYDEYENAYGPSAWQVWSPAEVPWLLDETVGWEAYSGGKCLISWGATGYMPEDMEPTVYPVNNDWLISPEVVGGTTLSFVANSPFGGELFEVLVSSTDDNPDSFVVLSSEELSSSGWTEYIYELPLNTKYFAIRYVSVYVFAMLLDDVSYVPIGSSTDIQLKGYNVYRNREKVNSNLLSENSYTENAVSADYAVTVVWDKGESVFSNVVNITVTAINTPDSNILVYGRTHAIVVEGAEGMNLAVYSLDGKQIHTAIADRQTIVPVNQGIYVVKVNDKAMKVIVK